MPRIQALDFDKSSGKAKTLLETIQATLGNTSNLVRTMANSPAVLEGYVSLCTALDHGALSPRMRERIALTVTQANDCQYCLAAHTAIARTVGLSEEAIADSRRADSPDRQEASTLQFVHRLLEEGGRVRDEDVARLRHTGMTDGEILEVVANVSMNLLTNYVTHVAATEVDFPPVPPLADQAPAPDRSRQKK